MFMPLSIVADRSYGVQVMQILLLILISISGLAQDHGLETIIKTLEDPEEEFSLDRYNIIQCGPPSEAEINKVVSLAAQCKNEQFEKCLELCELKLGASFELFPDSLNSGLKNKKLPTRNFTCSHMQEWFSDWLEKKCPKIGPNSFSLDQMHKYFSTLKKVHSFRADEPANHCYERAFLLADDLQSKGYRPSILELMVNNSKASLVLNYKGEVGNFRNHWVVQLHDDKGDAYILDPQFFNKIYSKAEYTKRIIKGGSVSEINQREFHYLSGHYSKELLTKTCEELRLKEQLRINEILK